MQCTAFILEWTNRILSSQFIIKLVELESSRGFHNFIVPYCDLLLLMVGSIQLDISFFVIKLWMLIKYTRTNIQIYKYTNVRLCLSHHSLGRISIRYERIRILERVWGFVHSSFHWNAEPTLSWYLEHIMYSPQLRITCTIRVPQTECSFKWSSDFRQLPWYWSVLYVQFIFQVHCRALQCCEFCVVNSVLSVIGLESLCASLSASSLYAWGVLYCHIHVHVCKVAFGL